MARIEGVYEIRFVNPRDVVDGVWAGPNGPRKVRALMDPDGAFVIGDRVPMLVPVGIVGNAAIEYAAKLLEEGAERVRIAASHHRWVQAQSCTRTAVRTHLATVEVL